MHWWAPLQLLGSFAPEAEDGIRSIVCRAPVPASSQPRSILPRHQNAAIRGCRRGVWQGFAWQLCQELFGTHAPDRLGSRQQRDDMARRRRQANKCWCPPASCLAGGIPPGILVSGKQHHSHQVMEENATARPHLLTWIGDCSYCPW